MSSVPKPYLTPEEYLAIERKAEIKSEYYQGEMFAMSGASREHVVISGNINGELHQHFKDRPCESYQSDMRVKVDATGLYTYPDVIAVCGEPRFEDSHVDTLLNPVVVFEVLSDSTESYDRGKKASHYRTVDSLKEHILVSQHDCRVEQMVRQDGSQWLLTELTSLEQTLKLTSIDAEIPLSEIYRKVDLSRQESES